MPKYNLYPHKDGEWISEDNQKVILQEVHLPGEFPGFIELDSEADAIDYFKLTKSE
jgi:hypothetical protein